MAQQIQLRRGTVSQWSSANPILALGEMGAEYDTGRFKIGDGSLAWNSLPYNSGVPGAAGATGATGPTGPAGSIPASHTLYVDKTGNDSTTTGSMDAPFLTIAAALAFISGNTATNTFLIQVGPGTFTCVQLNVPSYTSVRGSGINVTNIVAAGSSQHMFNLGIMCEVSFLSISGVGSGYAALHTLNIGGVNFTQSHKISIYDCDIGIWNHATTADSTHYAEYVDVNGTFTHACKTESTGAFVAYTNLENWYTFPTVCTTEQILATGNSVVDMFTGAVNGVGTDTGISIYNGAILRVSGIVMTGSNVGILLPNTGAASNLIVSAEIVSTVHSVNIQHPTSTGSITGLMDYESMIISSPLVYLAVSGITGVAGKFVLHDIYQGTDLNTVINLSDLTRDCATAGIEECTGITVVSGRQINVAAGEGYLIDPTSLSLKHVLWGSTNLTIPANSEAYIYVDTTGTVSQSAGIPDALQTIRLGRCYADASALELAVFAPVTAIQHGNAVEAYLLGLGAIFGSGAGVSEGGTRNLNITAGSWFYGSVSLASAGGSAVPFDTWYKNGSGGWTEIEAATVVDNNHYDDGSGTLATMTAGYYAKHSLYLAKKGATETYHMVYSQAQYSTLQAAQTASISVTPTWIKNSVPLLATIIVQNGATNLAQINDERPRMGFKASGISSITSHSDLTNLSADDHAQYLLVAGTRAMTGNLAMGAHNITGVGLVDGVTVSAHEARHLPNGADPLTTAAASTISMATTNTAGTANSLARSDHTHAITPLVAGDIPALPSSKITTGQFPLARGGSGADLSATGGTGQYVKQVTVGGNFTVGDIAVSELPTGIDATKLGGGTLTNTILGYLDPTSSVQTQLNNLVAADTANGKGHTLYGDGSDGAVTWTTNQTLTRDWFCTTLAVNSGVTVTMGDYRIFTTGQASVNGATFASNGVNAAGQTAGTVSSNTTISPPGQAGGAGGNAANGTSATAGVIASGTSGAGGTGNGGARTGGLSRAAAITSFFHNLAAALEHRFLTTLFCGQGGGGGGGGSTGVGGGGGGGGGFCCLFFHTVTGTFTMTALGGNGGNGGATNGGGGGGGGGGFCALITDTASPSVTQTVTGGSGGALNGTGAVGSAGSAGIAAIFINS